MNPLALVATLRERHGAITARELAARLSIEIHQASWQIAEGQVVQFAECSRQPKRITLNSLAIDQVMGEQVNNLLYEQLVEVILAHELFHLLTPVPSLWAKHAEIENAAHAFVQSWTGLPFHPTKYEKMLWATFSA